MFGLICIGCPGFESEKFSLKSVSVDCSVRNLLVTCTSEFVYKNTIGQNAEALFSFPLEGSCVVYHFEALIGGKTILGVCKEVEEAKNLYKAATEAGQKAAIIQRNRSMQDVFECRIGNMPKDSEAKITLKFAMELKLSLSKSEDDGVDRFSLCLPLILRPRYTPQNYEGDVTVFQVNNKYDYSFRADVIGTKEIKNVFSNNHQLKLVLTGDGSTHGQVTLESKYDGTHDLDVYIDYMKMRVPSVLYEYGASSSKFSGNKVNGAFYQTDVAMLNFLPEFEKSNDTQNKMEIVIVVDRSGSMQGSNIQHAKECLLIFLRSLPTNCKFQIYGFGSTFDKVFPHPQLYDEQSIELAMNYQRTLNADFGGTELMNPLRDLYSSSLTNDYTRVVFLLTDGDVGNQDEVFRLVRQHNHSTRLFTVGIGDGVSTSLVEKVAESGLGKSAFVRDSKTLSASVIELLDIALNCDQFTDCKIEWQCPPSASVVMVPSTIGPVFSNYFLTMFCMINGLNEDDTITCNLSGKVNDKLIKLSLDVSAKNGGVSDDEFRVHRLLAKYKINDMTTQIDDGQQDLKKSLIELSLTVNMVTNYTTFVAIDHDAPDAGLILDEPEPFPFMAMACRSGPVPQTIQCFAVAPPPPPARHAVYRSRICNSFSAGPPPPAPPPAAPCGGMAMNFGTGFQYSSQKCSNEMIVHDGATEEEAIVEDMVLYLAEHQHINGSWTNDESVLIKLGIDCAKVTHSKPGGISDEVWMTILIYEYLLTKMADREKEWRLFAKKAKQWLTKNITESLKLDKLLEHGRSVLR